MAETITKPRLDITTEIEQIRQNYSEKKANKLITALVLGPTGSGKTKLIETCRRPIHIDSFDPDGTSTVRKGIKEGWIIADTSYEHDNPKDPYVFEKWDKDYERRSESGYFEHMGTYVLDGLTMWSEAIMNLVLKGMVRKADRASDNKSKGVTAIDTDYLVIPQQNDWPLQMKIIANALADIIRLPCDVLIIGHTEDKTDKEGNVKSRGLYITGKLFIRIPRMFEEIYIMQRVPKPQDDEFWLCTHRTDGVDARTRLGSGIFANKEKPDIFALLKKAGLNPQHKDMGWMKKEEKSA